MFDIVVLTYFDLLACKGLSYILIFLDGFQEKSSKTMSKFWTYFCRHLQRIFQCIPILRIHDISKLAV